MLFVTFSQNPVQAYGLSFIFSVSGYLGITFVLTLIKAFGALVAVTGEPYNLNPIFNSSYPKLLYTVNNGAFYPLSVTTGRKAVTMVLSFIFFAKPFTIK